MNKKIAFILIVLLCNVCHLYSQKSAYRYSTHCSTLITQVSNNWKRDSLGKTGYRHKLSTKLLRCKIDNVNEDELIKWLGKPNEKWETNTVITCCYHFYFGRRKDGWVHNMKILFEFDIKTMRLIHISAIQIMIEDNNCNF